MWALFAGVILLVLKWLEVEPVSTWSWWWVLSPLIVAWIWFEWLERWFGRDKRSMEAAQWESARRERIKNVFAPKKKP